MRLLRNSLLVLLGVAVGLRLSEPVLADLQKFGVGTASGAAVTITGGATNTSGCSAGGILYSASNLVQCNGFIASLSAGTWTLATATGTNGIFLATAPTATTGASQVGKNLGITASAAVASTDTAGAAAGGNVTLTGGAAARFTSGNANGGDIIVVGGAGIGTGVLGNLNANGVRQIIAGASTAAAPVYTFNNQLGDGMYWDTNAIAFSLGGVVSMATRATGNTGTYVHRDYAIGWSSTTNATGTPDLWLGRRAGAVLMVGNGDIASPVSQSIVNQGAVGSNVAGAATFTLEPSRSTGTANGGDMVLNRVPTTQGSGSTQNTGVEGLRVVSRSFALTSASAATVFTVTGLGAHKRTAGTWDFTVEASDGTNDQAVSCSAEWAAVDTTAGAGGETCANTLTQTTCSCAAGFGACSAGTLAVTVAATTGTDLCNIRVTSTTSLTATTHRILYQVRQNGVLGTINPQ